MAERQKEQMKMSKTNPDRLNLPGSPECGQWETLLVDALDGTLRPEDEGTFTSHLATCSSCTEMFEQARRGQEWLEFLTPEPEVPSYLLEKILHETAYGKMDAATLAANKLAVAGGPADESGNVLAMPPVWQRPGFNNGLRRFAEPRLLMTAAMAFFSIALTISMTGVRITGFKVSDLRPAALRSQVEKRIMTASTPLIRYYDHLRFVYEVESRMRELRKSTDNGSSPDAKSKPEGGEGESHKKDGGSSNGGSPLNPNEAPLQTVNPPASSESLPWSGDALEARYELPHVGRFNMNRGFAASAGLPVVNEASAVATPDRSLTCLA
jgi:hypothetical protein